MVVIRWKDCFTAGISTLAHLLPHVTPRCFCSGRLKAWLSWSVPKCACISPAGSEPAGLAREGTLARSTALYNPVIRDCHGTMRLLTAHQQMMQEDGVVRPIGHYSLAPYGRQDCLLASITEAYIPRQIDNKQAFYLTCL